jgi:hypothetical protein
VSKTGIQEKKKKKKKKLTNQLIKFKRKKFDKNPRKWGHLACIGILNGVVFVGIGMDD